MGETEKQTPEFVLHVGPMMSGKSAALISDMKKYTYAGYNVIGLKPGAELRDDGIASRNGEKIRAYSLQELSEWTARFALDDVDVIGVDEAFMFEADDAYKCVQQWRSKGKVVLAATLDLSGMGKPMSTYTKLLEAGPKVQQHEAVCAGDDCSDMNARFTQIRNAQTNEVIREGLPEIVPEDPSNPQYLYNPVCWDCFYIED